MEQTLAADLAITNARKRFGRTEGPRDRLLRAGPSALTDPELLAVLFGTGFRGNPVLNMADRLLDAGGGLKALAQNDPQELCAMQGLGPARAAQMLAAMELGRRVQKSVERRLSLKTPQALYEYLVPDLGPLRREVFHVLCFNTRNVLLRNARVAEGSMNSCPVDPREVFGVALASKATALVLAHNHPSGDPEPSELDLTLTNQLREGAQLLGLRILDHLVVASSGYVSFAARGVLDPPPVKPHPGSVNSVRIR